MSLDGIKSELSAVYGTDEQLPSKPSRPFVPAGPSGPAGPAEPLGPLGPAEPLGPLGLELGAAISIFFDGDALGDGDFEGDTDSTGEQLGFGIAELIVGIRLLQEVNNAISETMTARIETIEENLFPGCLNTTQYDSFMNFWTITTSEFDSLGHFLNRRILASSPHFPRIRPKSEILMCITTNRSQKDFMQQG